MIDSTARQIPLFRFCSRSLIVWSAAILGAIMPTSVHATVDALDVCTYLLRAIDRVAPRANDEHPVRMFYRAIDTSLWSASAEAFGPELAAYVAPEDLPAFPPVRPDQQPQVRLRLREELAHAYRALFKAAAVTGHDHDLALLNLAMHEVDKDVIEALHSGHRGEFGQFVDAAAMRRSLEGEAAWRLNKHLTNARLAWLALTPAQQHAFVAWVGRVIYDYAPMWERSWFDQELWQRTGERRTETTRYIPEFKMSKEDFVRNEGGNPARAEGAFYRHVGGQWMRLYGIIFFEDPRLPAPPLVTPPVGAAASISPSWFARLFGR